MQLLWQERQNEARIRLDFRKRRPQLVSSSKIDFGLMVGLVQG